MAVTGRLKPGQLISQRELVETTGLTLSAVREAIPRLEAEGLLQTLPQRGLMVPSLDVTFVRLSRTDAQLAARLSGAWWFVAVFIALGALSLVAGIALVRSGTPRPRRR